MPTRQSARQKPGRVRRADAFARLFEAAREGVYIGTLRPGGTTTIAANPHLKLMFGHPGETQQEAVTPFDASRFVDPQARAALLERLARDGAVTDYLLRLRRADGTPMWVEVTAHADPPRARGGMRIEALIRDVSERKKLEDQARDLNHQLLQAEKLASLGQTISGVAHELNNPLATILTRAERLAGHGGLDEVARRGVETILGEAERAARIVRHLLSFARKRQTTRAMVDLNQLVRQTLALRVYEQRVANINVIEALPAGLPAVFADPHQIQQVLLNLVINAEQAMISSHGRGTLVLRTWHNPDLDVVILEVNDDGPGIDENVQAKIFDPFFTTKEVGQGTGLGLAVAYALVQEHGGRLTVRSQADAGASFFIELPAGGAEIRPAPAPVQAGADVGGGAAVLVVEDEPALAAAVAESLADAGYLVDRASDGEEALARVRDRTYDLIICDLKMPRLDGPAFFRTVASERPVLTRRIVFVTGDVAGTQAEAFLEDSGCRWLAKPFRLAELLRVARDVLA